MASTERARGNNKNLNVRKQLYNCEGDQTQEQAAWRGSGHPPSSETFKPAGYGPDQGALAKPALSKGLEWTPEAPSSLSSSM